MASHLLRMAALHRYSTARAYIHVPQIRHAPCAEFKKIICTLYNYSRWRLSTGTAMRMHTQHEDHAFGCTVHMCNGFKWNAGIKDIVRLFGISIHFQACRHIGLEDLGLCNFELNTGYLWTKSWLQSDSFFCKMLRFEQLLNSDLIS